MGKSKCLLCEMRYVNHQEWKNDFEKNHCPTCISFLKTIQTYEDGLNSLARTSNINKTVQIRVNGLTGVERLIKYATKRE